jgi:hypothetical protein
MESLSIEDTKTETKSPVDHSRIVTFIAGEGGAGRQYYLFAEPRICRESLYVREHLHGNFLEATTLRFFLHETDAPALACLHSWYIGGDCLGCHFIGAHIIDAYVLGIRFRVRRFKEHLIQKMKAWLEHSGTEATKASIITRLLDATACDTDMFHCLNNFRTPDKEMAPPGQQQCQTHTQQLGFSGILVTYDKPGQPSDQQ